MSKTSEREYPEKQIAVGKAGFVVQLRALMGMNRATFSKSF